MSPRECPCGSGKACEALYDARGIFCSYVCDACEDSVRSKYRLDVFTDPDYWAEEPIEPDDLNEVEDLRERCPWLGEFSD